MAKSAPTNTNTGAKGYSGWFQNDVDGTLDLYRQGTKIAAYSSALNALTGAITASTTVTAGTGVTATTGGVTATAGGMTATAGNITATAGDVRVTAANVRLGAVATFGTTEPTSWVVCKNGTQPAGAITTSGGIGSDATTVQKIIAAGTINNVET